MTVVGIDTKARGFHWVSSEPIWDATSDDLEPTRCGWQMGVSSEGEARIRLLIFSLARMFFRNLPSGAHVFVESPLVLPKNVETTRKLVMSAGVIELAFHVTAPDATWFWVDPQSWKKRVFGRAIPPKEFEAPKTKRTKLWIQEQARDRVFDEGYPEAIFAAEPDLYDAWGLMHYGLSEVTV